MGLLKKAKEKAEEAAKKTGHAAEKVGREGFKLGKKGAKKTEEAAKKVKKKLQTNSALIILILFFSLDIFSNAALLKRSTFEQVLLIESIR